MERYENTYLGLLDISFSRFVTEGVLKVLYVLAVTLAAIGMIIVIIAAFLNYGIGQGIGALILAPAVFIVIAIFIRVVFEIFMVIFRIADYLQVIAENTVQSSEGDTAAEETASPAEA